jgi:hypothetical protein
MPTQDFKGSVTIPASGGVDFSANHSAANHSNLLLDSYEEGAWSPTIWDASTGGNQASTGSISGAYTKIGNLVSVTMNGDAINTTGMTAGNTVYIRGLPFTASAMSLGSVYLYRITFSGFCNAGIPLSTNYVNILDYVSTATDGYVIVSDISSGNSSIYFSLTYHTAT